MPRWDDGGWLAPDLPRKGTRREFRRAVTGTGRRGPGWGGPAPLIVSAV